MILFVKILFLKTQDGLSVRVPEGSSFQSMFSRCPLLHNTTPYTAVLLYWVHHLKNRLMEGERNLQEPFLFVRIKYEIIPIFLYFHWFDCNSLFFLLGVSVFWGSNVFCPELNFNLFSFFRCQRLVSDFCSFHTEQKLKLLENHWIQSWKIL